jgi:hypothetical protein
VIDPDRGPRSMLTSWIPFQTGGSNSNITGIKNYEHHRVTSLALVF